MTLGLITQFSPNLAGVAERAIELLAFTGRGREVVLKKDCLFLSCLLAVVLDENKNSKVWSTFKICFHLLLYFLIIN